MTPAMGHCFRPLRHPESYKGRDVGKPNPPNGPIFVPISTAGGKIVETSLRGFEKVEFTKHCQDQMKFRGLLEAEVLRVISEPEVTDLPTPEPRKRHRRYRSSDRSVDVIFEDLPDRVLVITAMIRSLKADERLKP
jgi:hypothetical protein